VRLTDRSALVDSALSSLVRPARMEPTSEQSGSGEHGYKYGAYSSIRARNHNRIASVGRVKTVHAYSTLTAARRNRAENRGTDRGAIYLFLPFTPSNLD